jgi:hypothetical protein
MMDLSKLTQGEWIVLIAGVLLVLDLLFAPWHKIDLGASIPGIGALLPDPEGTLRDLGTVTRSGVQSPHSGYGILALLLAIVMVGQIVAAKLLSASLPDLPVPWSQIHLILGGGVAALLLLKLVVETDFLGFGAYVGVALGMAVAFGGVKIKQADSSVA